MGSSFETQISEITDDWREKIDSILDSNGVVINDPVHGSIRLNGLEASVLDLPPIQRLREVRQLGAASVLYPAANHTRFEHTVGTYHTSKIILDCIERQVGNDIPIDGVQKQEVRIAALLHDIGHLPFSHPTEPLVRAEIGNLIKEDKEFRYGGVHEYIGWKLISSKFFTRLFDDVIIPHYRKKTDDDLACEGFNLNRVKSMIVGDYRDPSGQYDSQKYQFLADAISGAIDADRLDYLQRESHKVGFPSFVDTDRIFDNIHISEFPIGSGKHRLGINAKAVEAAKSLIMARDRLVQIVHDHHVTTVAEDVMLRAINENFESPIELIGQSDYELFARLLDEDDIWDFRGRNLPKRYAFFAPSDGFYSKTRSGHIRHIFGEMFSSIYDRMGFEEQIASTFDLEGRVIVSHYRGPVSVTPNVEDANAEDLPVFDENRDSINRLKVYMRRKYKSGTTMQRPQIRVFAGWENMKEGRADYTEDIKMIVAEKMGVDDGFLKSDYKHSTYQNILG